MRTPFLSSAYTSRSSNLAADRLINLEPEFVETKEGKEVGAFYGTPGLDLLWSVGNGPIRGLYATPSLLYLVSGNTLYSINVAQQIVALATLSTNFGAVSMIWNGTQLGIADGVSWYVWDGSTLTTPTWQDNSPPVKACYQDGFGLITSTGTNKFWQTNYFDFKTIGSLNFGSVDSHPGPMVSIISTNREAWCFGANNCEVWVNVGASGFAFQRLQGVNLEVGCVAPFSVVKLDHRVAWIGQNENGTGTAYISEGYRAKRVSTHAVETEWATYSTISDAIAYAYQYAGHSYLVLSFPSGNATWVFDLASGLWHERLSFANGAWSRHWAQNHAYWNGMYVVGDYRNGLIYSLNRESYTDNGTPRKWLRAWRATPKPADRDVTFASLSIDMESGIKVPAGVNPIAVLRWSDDGGHTWSNEMQVSMGAPGQTAKDVVFRRLGSTRRGTGMDRVFELSSDAPVRAALIGAVMEAI